MKFTIDINSQTMKTDYSWQFGLGCDHAHQLLRVDVCEHLKLAKEELGIKTLRFHGIFDDDMDTYNNLKAFAPLPGRRNEVKEVNFRQCGRVYDNLLALGVKPFVELSFMPTPLASGKKTGLHYKNNTTPPKSYEEWAEYITEFVKFLINRYGKEEVESWKFEVWNEPDLKGGFFSGSQKDYFKLYEYTARAIKAVDENIQVGGPSTSACKWIEEFISFCKEKSVPLDFVSTHHYPGDAFGNFIDTSNYFGIFKTMMKAMKERRGLADTMTDMFFHPEKAMQVPKGALAKMDDDLRAKTDLPLYMTEWNSMAIFCAPVHDEKYSAAFVIKTVLDLNHQFEGYQFWCLSDIFEELVQINKPFFGGYGIITNDGIPKPNFWAFKMLSKLGEQRLIDGFRSEDEVEYAVFKNGKDLQILIFSQSNDPKLDKSFEVELSVNFGAKEVLEERIDDQNCNPKLVWREMGEPTNPTKKEVEIIKEKSRLTAREVAFSKENGNVVIKTELRTNDVVLFTLKG